MMIWLITVTGAVLLSPFISRYKRVIAIIFLLVLPVLRDGPLDVNLWEWKFAFVSALFLLSLQEHNRLLSSLLYAKSIVLLSAVSFIFIFSHLLNNTPGVGKNAFLVFLTMAIFFASLCRMFNASLLRAGMLSIVVITVTACLLTFLQYMTIRFNLSYPALVYLLPPEMRAHFFEQNYSLDWRGIRLSSFFFHSNQLGHFLAVSFGFLFPLFLYSKKTHIRLLYMLMLAIIVFCTIIAQSRGALLLIIIAIVLTICFNIAIHWKKHLSFIAILLLAMISGIIFLESNFTHFLNRLTSLDLSFRRNNWSYALELIPNHYLFGVGPGNSSYHILQKFPVIQFEEIRNAYLNKQPFNYWSSHPHNYYLNTILETGVFSLIIQLILFGSAVTMGVRQVVRPLNELHKALALGATIVLITRFLYGIFESYSFFGAPATGAVISFSFALLLYLNSWRGYRVS